MKKTTAIFLILFSCYELNAQDDKNYFNIKDYHSVLNAGSSMNLASSTFSCNFMNTLLFKDYLDHDIKNRMFRTLEKENFLGFDFDSYLSYAFFPDTIAGLADLGLYFQLSDHNHLDITASSDLAKLFFGGNKQFKGKNADIGNSSMNFLKYRQLQIGMISRFATTYANHSFGVGISINDGIEHSQLKLNKGTIFTAADAEYLDVAADYEISQSDTSRKDHKGFGTSMNIYYSMETHNNHCFEISLTDMGFIRWNKNSTQLFKDTSFHYEGVSIEDPLNIEGNVFNDLNTDTLSHSFLEADTTLAYFMATPASFRINYRHSFTDRFYMEWTFVKKLFVNYDACIMTKAICLLGKKTMVSLNLNYGGYTGGNPYKNHSINTGIEIMHEFGNSCIFTLGTNYLNGLLNPKTQTGQGAYVSIKKYFF